MLASLGLTVQGDDDVSSSKILALAPLIDVSLTMYPQESAELTYDGKSNTTVDGVTMSIGLY